MNPAIEPLVIAYLEGSLAEPDAAALAEHLRTNPEDRDEFLALCQQERLLGSLGAGGDESLRIGVLEEILARKESPKFVKDVLERLPERKASRRRARHSQAAPKSPLGLILGIAAAALFALIVFLLASPSDAPVPRPAPIVDRPERPEPPPVGHDEPKSLPVPDALRPPVARRTPKEPTSEKREGVPEPAKTTSPKAVSQPESREKIPTERPEPDPKRQRQIEEDTRRERKGSRKPGAPPAAVPRPKEPPKSQPEPPPSEEKGRPTRAAIAKLGQVQGEVFIIQGAEKVPARTGQDLLAGQGLETSKEGSLAIIMFPDQTTLRVAEGTTIRALDAAGGKRLTFHQGVLSADVTLQPKGTPMVFTTPHGEATVLGTTLRLTVNLADPDKGSTRLEVEEGRVKLKRKLDGKSVTVPSGHFAVAADGVPLESKPIDLLADGGFEGGGKGWQKVGLNHRPLASSPVRQGARSLQIGDPIGGRGNATGERDVFQEIPVKSGRAYRVTAWVKTQRTTATAYLVWLKKAGLGLVALPPDLVLRTELVGSVTGPRDWTRLRSRKTAPRGAVVVRLHLMAGDVSKASAWFDDCEINPVGR